MWRSSKDAWIGILGFGFLVSSAVNAQAHPEGRPIPAELLSRFAEEQATLGGPDEATATLTGILLKRAEPATAQALLNGLEDLALVNANANVRQAAVVYLAMGSRFYDAKPAPGAFARLKRIYDQTRDNDVRSMVVITMGSISERKESVAFLDKIARQDPAREEFSNAAVWALRALSALGDEGRAELKLLHDSKAVVHPEARYGLAELARRGYKLN